MTAALPTFRINLTPGRSTVVMNDEDISAHVRSIAISQPGPMEMPAVILEIPSPDIEVTGTGVTLVDGGIWQKLDEIEPAELDNMLTVRMAYGDSPGQLALDIIKELLRGDQS